MHYALGKLRQRKCRTVIDDSLAGGFSPFKPAFFMQKYIYMYYTLSHYIIVNRNSHIFAISTDVHRRNYFALALHVSAKCILCLPYYWVIVSFMVDEDIF